MDAQVVSADALSMVVAHSRGVSTVAFENCSLGIQALYGYNPKEAEKERKRRELEVFRKELEEAERAAAQVAKL